VCLRKVLTGCEFSGEPTLPALAAGKAKSGGCVWGRQKKTWHAEAAWWRKCAGALRVLRVPPSDGHAASASIFSSHFKRLHRSAKLATSYHFALQIDQLRRGALVDGPSQENIRKFVGK